MKPELLSGIETPEGLRCALQQAIKLEHSTIPPYLYSLYSIMPGENTEIATIISSVVAEEMAHMALACNVLNAIGGSPVIDEPRFIPTYPGPLPGAVEDQLTVHLAPFSIKQVENVFMIIEQPADPLDIPDAAVPNPPITIGELYNAIREQVVAAGEGIFIPDHSRQVYGGIALPEVKAVTDVTSAVSAIETIIEQGEGTSTSPEGDAPGDELAHYYRFAEIKEGAQLVPAPGETPPWRYNGQPIPFDASKVYPVIADPKASSYPAGSGARYGCDTFNYTYTSLLKALHDTFNGNPHSLATAVGVMESLNEQAQALMTLESGIGGNAGPSFEYQPTNS
ncbi:MAG: ferritin-like protein [Actinomycetota bacterium]|nr:ferritin-like protein [Actinomycetota bacterium]